MKIAIFTISLGKYDIFFDELYSSVNTNFLSNHEKHFFVFTDKEFTQKENLTQIKQEKLENTSSLDKDKTVRKNYFN